MNKGSLYIFICPHLGGGGGVGGVGGLGTFLKQVKLVVEKFQKKSPKTYQDLASGECALNNDILYLHCCAC